MKQKLFFCHRHDESELAAYLKERLNLIFGDSINFVSASEKSPFIGEDRWLNKLDMAIKDSSLVLALCDRNTAASAWVNFNAGSAWMAGKRLVLLRHGGMQAHQLHQPLASFQSYDITNPNDFKNLVKLLSFTTCLSAQDFDAVRIVASLPTAKAGGREEAPLTAAAPAEVAASEKASDLQYLNALRADYEFDKKSGIHRHNTTSLCVCTTCLLEGMESPLTEYEVGWQCNRKGCEKFYSNPDYPSLATSDLDYDPFSR